MMLKVLRVPQVVPEHRHGLAREILNIHGRVGSAGRRGGFSSLKQSQFTFAFVLKVRRGEVQRRVLMPATQEARKEAHPSLRHVKIHRSQRCHRHCPVRRAPRKPFSGRTTSRRLRGCCLFLLRAQLGGKEHFNFLQKRLPKADVGIVVAQGRPNVPRHLHKIRQLRGVPVGVDRG
eukprot:scaffold1355_cov268-Pinguiococcus_pyrenoidosus.AAC.47